MGNDLKKEYWEKSYQRGENFIFFPKEEIVKFVNRFIRKKIGITEYRDFYSNECFLNALDYGCGIGRNTIFLKELGFESVGIDISDISIENAISLASTYSFMCSAVILTILCL